MIKRRVYYDYFLNPNPFKIEHYEHAQPLHCVQACVDWIRVISWNSHIFSINPSLYHLILWSTGLIKTENQSQTREKSYFFEKLAWITLFFFRMTCYILFCETKIHDSKAINLINVFLSKKILTNRNSHNCNILPKKSYYC